MRTGFRCIVFVLTFTEPESSAPRRTLGFASSTVLEPNPAPPAKLLLGQGLQPALIDLTALQVGLPALTPPDLAAILVRQNGVFTTVTGLFADHVVTLELTTDAQELMAVTGRIKTNHSEVGCVMVFWAWVRKQIEVAGKEPAAGEPRLRPRELA